MSTLDDKWIDVLVARIRAGRVTCHKCSRRATTVERDKLSIVGVCGQCEKKETKVMSTKADVKATAGGLVRFQFLHEPSGKERFSFATSPSEAVAFAEEIVAAAATAKLAAAKLAGAQTRDEAAAFAATLTKRALLERAHALTLDAINGLGGAVWWREKANAWLNAVSELKTTRETSVPTATPHFEPYDLVEVLNSLPKPLSPALFAYVFEEGLMIDADRLNREGEADSWRDRLDSIYRRLSGEDRKWLESRGTLGDDGKWRKP